MEATFIVMLVKFTLLVTERIISFPDLNYTICPLYINHMFTCMGLKTKTLYKSIESHKRLMNFTKFD